MGFSCRRGGGATSRGTRLGQRKRPAAALTPASPTAPSGVTARAIPAAVRRHSSGFLTDMKGSRPICLPARVAPTGTLLTALAVELSQANKANGICLKTKQAVSPFKTALIAPRNRPFRNAIRPVSPSRADRDRIQHRPFAKPII